MGQFFGSFDEAWPAFLARREPLEWFFRDFPEADGAVGAGWVIEPSDWVKDRIEGLQRVLAGLDWLVPVPRHFLHLWLGSRDAIGARSADWEALQAFDVAYRRVGCFHSAVVVEAHAPELAKLVGRTAIDMRTFLPHVTIAVTTETHAPDELRERLVPLRESILGTSRANGIDLVEFPASRATLFQPWSVVGSVALRR